MKNMWIWLLDVSYVVKFELGLFENPYQGADMPGVAMRTKEAVELSRRVADESIVLLKNEKYSFTLKFE